MALRFLNSGYFAGKVGIGDASPFSLLQVGSNTFSGGNGMFANSRVGISNHGILTGMMLASTYNDPDYPEYGLVFVQGPSTSNYDVWSISPDGPAKGSGLSFIFKANVTNIHNQTPQVYFEGSTGNVGIGTDSPAGKLHVSDTATLTAVYQKFTNGTTGHTSNDGTTLGIDADGDFLINNNEAKEIKLYTSDTQRLTISSAGAVKFNSYNSTNNTGTPTYILGTDASGNVVKVLGGDIPGVPGGSGTLNTIPLWTPDGDTLGDSPITISGNDIISSGRGVIENTTNLTTGVVDSLLIKTLSSATTITNGFGGGLSFYLENTVYSAVNEVAKIAVIETDTTAIDDKMVFSVKDNNILAERLTLTGSEAVFTGNVGIGVTGPSEKLEVAGNIKIQAALLSNQENTNVDTGTEAIASVVLATYTAAFFDFVIKKGTNVRSGTVYACHDGTSVAFTETSTQDLGDTSDVTLNVVISTIYLQLQATTTSDDWSVKSLIRAI